MIDFYPAELSTIGRERTSMKPELFPVMQMSFGNGIVLAPVNSFWQTKRGSNLPTYKSE